MLKGKRRSLVAILIVAAIVSLLLAIAVAQSDKPKHPVKKPIETMELTKGKACQILARKCENEGDVNACGHWLAHCQQ